MQNRIILGLPVKKVLHRRGTEFAEFGEFFNLELFTLRSPRLRGAISEFCFA
jgi:hypothetical protein